MQLSDIIKQRIKIEGPISFHDFMEMALYYPGLGYYTSPKEKIGKDGDFYTSCNLTPAFGATIAKQLEEMHSILGGEEFTIVEYGAGTGQLCKDILAYIKNNKKLYKILKYCIVEKSEVMRAKAKKLITEKVNWCNNITEIPKFTGCILSNELVDNFSVHLVVMQDQLMEVFVDYQSDFIEVLKPAKKELVDYLVELKINLPKGFRTEINLNATRWINEISIALNKGYVMTIDYGYPSSELYCEDRNNGTIVCYNKHKTNYQPYNNIGEQDITSHVNFSALCLWGYKNGLDFCGFRDQGPFLCALGFKDHLNFKIQQKSDLIHYQQQERISQILLEEMGHKFKVLIQQKNLHKHELLGLKRDFIS